MLGPCAARAELRPAFRYNERVALMSSHFVVTCKAETLLQQGLEQRFQFVITQFPIVFDPCRYVKLFRIHPCRGSDDLAAAIDPERVTNEQRERRIVSCETRFAG